MAKNSCEPQLVAQIEIQLSMLLSEIEIEKSRIEISKQRTASLSLLAEECRSVLSNAGLPSVSAEVISQRRGSVKKALLTVLAQADKPLTAAVLSDRVQVIAGSVQPGTISVTLARLRAEDVVELNDRRRWTLVKPPIHDHD